MKRNVLAGLFLMILFSCQKDPGSPTSLSSQFIGKWIVYESVDQSAFTQWHVTNDTFHSISVKITDTTFALVQSNRVPVPAWVGSGHYSADTLWMQPVISGRQLLNNFQGKVGTYSEKKDTLTLKYMYEGPIVSTSYGDDGSVYIVSQKWVRQ